MAGFGRARLTITTMMIAVAIVALMIFVARKWWGFTSGYDYDRWVDSLPLSGEQNPYPDAILVPAPGRAVPALIVAPDSPETE